MTKKTEAQFLAALRQLPPDGREYMGLLITILADLQGTPDAALFMRWMRSRQHAAAQHAADPDTLRRDIRTLRTGAWRREARQLQTRKMLRAMPRRAGRRAS